MNREALQKLVEEWRAGKMGTDASVRVAELACADQLAAVLAGGQEERALEDKYLRCDEHSPAPFGTPSCLFCELTKRQAEIERVESRARQAEAEVARLLVAARDVLSGRPGCIFVLAQAVADTKGQP